MTQETLLKARELNERIAQLHSEIVALQRPGAILRVYSNEAQFETISTIGTTIGCEHPDTKAAQQFLYHIIERRQKESSKLHAQFSEL